MHNESKMCKVYTVILLATRAAPFQVPKAGWLGGQELKALSTGDTLPSPARGLFHKTRNNGISNCAT